ncbi:hypothetical protein U1707_05920 [Sphingomonas sp. PB2P12]|uniref:DUF6894 family protein n=1 Tax=Sphingomonas sandaracina TaxID=3096157 RepID=UPI002FCB2B97
MPRYFFDIDTDKHFGDDDGTDLADDEEARAQAVIFTGDYLSDHPAMARDSARLRVAVRDGQGNVLLTATVTIEEPRAPA